MATLPADFWEYEARQLLAILLPRLTEAAQRGVALSFGFNNELANTAAAEWATRYTDDLLAQLNTTSEKLVGGVLDEWIKRPGSTIGELQQAIGDGLAINAVRAGTIAVTEVTRAYAEGNKVAYQQAGIEQVRWQTNHDELVCPICGPLNQQVRPLGEAFGEFRGVAFDAPPAHPNCRCWITPVVKRGERPETAPVAAPEPEPEAGGYVPVKPVPGGFTDLAEAQQWVNDHPNLDWDLLGIENADQANRVLKEVDAIVSRHPHINFDMTQAHVDAVMPTLQQFDRLSQEWPEVSARLKYVGTYAGPNPAKPGYVWKQTTYAHAWPKGDIIGLNPRFYGDPEYYLKELASDVKEKWHPPGCDTIESMMSHEFGHQVDNWLKTQTNQAFIDYGVVDVDGFGIVSETLRLWREQNQATDSLARYVFEGGGDIAKESFAEGFASILHSPKNKQVVFTKRLKTLLETMNKQGGFVTLDKTQWFTDLPMAERQAVREEINRVKQLLHMGIH